MGIKLKQISLKEKEELEPLIISDPDVIEDGLKIITHQLTTKTGPLDILAVDSDGTLVVIELKNEASESHMDQGLRYYDWCRQNIPWISNAYKNYKIIPENSPRLILLAPSFTENVKVIAKYVGVDLQLFEYHAVKTLKNEFGIICTNLDFGEPTVSVSIPTIEKKLEYIKNEKVKKLLENVINELIKINVEIKPIRGKWISFIYKEKRFMQVQVRQNWFNIRILKKDGSWDKTLNVKSKVDWNKIMKDKIFKFMNSLDNDF